MIHDQSPFFHFDDRAKRVLSLARQSAEGQHSADMAPEHVLLALLAIPHGLAARTMANLSGSRALVENAINEVLPVQRPPSPAHIPFTVATEEGMVRAAQQARLLGDDQIGTEHLLLGLLAATDNAAVRGLQELGVSYDTARAEITRLRADG